ncbi:ROK family protein [uncultured Cetobacterium sp.]|uniref:ROK family protein n=1 Tax=uncultured Cetobacterium sp. TaxID=527638 RepID=UPI00260CDAE2|nr:ROK family protein [uncultured Cetobacterium sp.]
MRYLSFDVGGTNIKYSLIDTNGNILKSDKYTTITNREEFLNKIEDIVKENSEKIDGLAFSMPGVIDVDRGYMITGGALYELYDYNFKEELEKRIKIPVEIENDVNCVALAEKWLGNAKENKNFICLTIGTGVGGALFINDKIVRGTKYSAGEFGFMITERLKNIADSTLSMRGSVRGGLIKSYANKVNQKWEELDGKKIFEYAENGDKIAIETIDEFYTNIAYSIFNLIVSLNPEKVLIGGEISVREDFIERVKEKLEKLKSEIVDLKNLEFPTIERCKFLNDSGKIGALYNFKLMQKSRMED